MKLRSTGSPLIIFSHWEEGIPSGSPTAQRRRVLEPVRSSPNRLRILQDSSQLGRLETSGRNHGISSSRTRRRFEEGSSPSDTFSMRSSTSLALLTVTAFAEVPFPGLLAPAGKVGLILKEVISSK